MISSGILFKIFKTSPLPSLLLMPNKNFTITEVNDAYLEATRSKESDIKGNGIIEILHELKYFFKQNDIIALKNSFHSVIQDKSIHKMELIKTNTPILGSSNFKVHYWEIENLPILDDNNEIVFILHTIKDITDHVLQTKRLEEKLKKTREKYNLSKARYRGIFDSQTNYVIRTDLQGNLTYSNNTFIRDFGWLYPYADIIGKNCMISVNEYHYQKVEETVGKCMMNPDKVFQLEIDKPRKDGGTRSTIWDFICLTDSKGQPSEIQCIGIDISDRKKALDALSNERNLLRTLIDNLPDYIYVKDRDFKHLINNKANLELIGAATEKETIGKSVLDYFEPDIAKKFIEDDKTVLESQIPVFNRVEFVNTKDGGEKWLLTTKVPLKDSHSEIIGLIGISKDISELKKGEQHLKMLESVITNANDSVMVTEADQIEEPGPKILYVNDAFTKMTGYSREEVLGKTPRILQGSKTDKKVLQLLKSALKKFEPFETNLINYKKNGEAFWINFTINPVADEKGSYTHFIAIERDITDRKIQEELLTEANRKITNTLESIQDGFFSLNKEGIVTYWNREAEKMLEVKRDEILGKNLWDFYKEIIKSEVFNDVLKSKFYIECQRAIKENISLRFEEYVRFQKRWYDISAFPSEDGLIIYFKDITNRKKAEKEIIRVYEERNNILESIGDAFFAVDKNWIITYWNNVAVKVMGKTKQEVVGKNMWDLYSGTFDSEIYILLHKAMDENIVQHFETYSESLKIWFEISVYPSANGLSIYLKDNTERKLYEIQLNELNVNLQKYSRELAISNKDLEHFAYVASHDLQEPLRMISGFLSLLEKNYDDVLDEDGKNYIKFAVDGSKRMQQIIVDLLEFSKVGRHEDNLESISIKKLIDDIILLYQKQINDTQAKIEYRGVPKIRTYKTPLNQVLQNLISNALKYHNKEEATIISIFAEQTPTHWQFSVKDNGIGIDPKFNERIFKIFQRLHGKSEYSGTGIGLAICKKIVENMNGKIWVTSEEGKGTTFYFTISKNL